MQNAGALNMPYNGMAYAKSRESGVVELTEGHHVNERVICA